MIDPIQLYFVIVLVSLFTPAICQLAVGLWEASGTEAFETFVGSLRLHLPAEDEVLSPPTLDVTGVSMWFYPLSSEPVDEMKINLSSVVQRTEEIWSFTNKSVLSPSWFGLTNYTGIKNLPHGVLVDLAHVVSADWVCVRAWFALFNSPYPARFVPGLFDGQSLLSCLGWSVQLALPSLHSRLIEFVDGQVSVNFTDPCTRLQEVCFPASRQVITAPDRVDDLAGLNCFLPSNRMSECGFAAVTRVVPVVSSHDVDFVASGMVVRTGPFSNKVVQFTYTAVCDGPTCFEGFAFVRLLGDGGLGFYVATLTNRFSSLRGLLELVDSPSSRRRCFCFVTCVGFGHCGGSGASKDDLNKLSSTLTSEINNNRHYLNELAGDLAAGMNATKSALSQLDAEQLQSAQAISSLSALVAGDQQELRSAINALTQRTDELSDHVTANAENADVRTALLRVSNQVLVNTVRRISSHLFDLRVRDARSGGDWSGVLGENWTSLVFEAFSGSGLAPVSASTPIASGVYRPTCLDSNCSGGGWVELTFELAHVESLFFVERLHVVDILPVYPDGSSQSFSPCSWPVAQVFRLVAGLNGSAAGGVYYRECQGCEATLATKVFDNDLIGVVGPSVRRCAADGFFKGLSSHVVNGVELKVDVSASNFSITARVVSYVRDVSLVDQLAAPLSRSELALQVLGSVGQTSRLTLPPMPTVAASVTTFNVTDFLLNSTSFHSRLLAVGTALSALISRVTDVQKNTSNRFDALDFGADDDADHCKYMALFCWDEIWHVVVFVIIVLVVVIGVVLGVRVIRKVVSRRKGEKVALVAAESTPLPRQEHTV